MKKGLFYVLMFFSCTVHAQTIKFNIKGTIANTDSIIYAYLTTLSQIIPISSDKIFMVVPVVNGKFEFKGDFDLKGEDFQFANVFVEERGNITKEEALSKFRRLIWVTGVRKNARVIILEDLTLSISAYGETKKAIISEGGILTKQIDESTKATQAGNREMIQFVKRHPSSKIAFYAVKEVTSSYNSANKDRYNSIWGSPSELFNELSAELKNSKKGIALKKRIDEKTKP